MRRHARTERDHIGGGAAERLQQVLSVNRQGQGVTFDPRVGTGAQDAPGQSSVARLADRSGMALARLNRSVTFRVDYPEGSVERNCVSRSASEWERDWGETMAAEGKYEREHQMTYADLCRAIEDGRLPFTIRDGHYEVRTSDVRRLRSMDRNCFALPDPTAIPAGLLDGLDQGQLNYSV